MRPKSISRPLAMALISLGFNSVMATEFLGFESIIGYIAAFCSLCLAISLIGHDRKKKSHIFLSLFLFNLCLGFSFRSLNFDTGESWMLSAAYLFFSFLPLLLAVFSEKLTQSNLACSTKVWVLLSVIFFSSTCWIYEVRTSTPWKLGYMIYHISSFLMISYQLFHPKKTQSLSFQEKNVYKSVLYTVLASSGCMLFEWLYALGPLVDERVRLAPFTLIFFVYFLVNIYFKESEFHFGRSLLCLGLLFLFSLVTAQVLLISGLVIGSFSLVTGLIFALAVGLSSINIQLTLGFIESSISHLILTLTRIDKKNSNFFLKDLNSISEFKKLTLISATKVEALSCEQAYSVLNNQKVITSGYLKKKIKSHRITNSELDQYQAALYLLQAHGIKAMIATKRNGPIIGASPINMRSNKYFESLLLWASQNYDLINNSSNSIPVKQKWPISPSEGLHL